MEDVVNTVIETVEHGSDWMDTAKKCAEFGAIGLGIGAAAAIGVGIFKGITGANEKKEDK